MKHTVKLNFMRLLYDIENKLYFSNCIKYPIKIKLWAMKKVFYFFIWQILSSTFSDAVFVREKVSSTELVITTLFTTLQKQPFFNVANWNHRHKYNFQI